MSLIRLWKHLFFNQNSLASKNNFQSIFLSETSIVYFTWYRVFVFIFFLTPLLVYFVPYIRGGNVLLLEDGLLYSYPMRWFTHQAYSDGFSPQWIPYSAGGFSLLAEGQTGLCSPFIQILYRLFSPEISWMIEIFFSRVLSFLLFMVWIQSLKVQWVASLFGSSIYAFCLPFFWSNNVPSIFWVYALMPGFFYLIDRLIKKDNIFIPTTLAFFLLLFLSGHPPVIIYAGIILGIYTFFRIAGSFKQENSAQKNLIFSVKLLSIITLAVFFALPQLLPMWEQAGFSARTTEKIDLVSASKTLSLNWRWFIYATFPVPQRPWTYHFWSENVHFPVFVFFLSSFSIFSKNKIKYCLIILGFLIIGLALGSHLPLWKLLHSLPILNQLRFPFRWLIFLPIIVAALSALGLEYLTHELFENKFCKMRQNFIKIYTTCFCLILILSYIFFIFRWSIFGPLLFARSPQFLIAICAIVALIITVCIVFCFFEHYRNKSIYCGITLTVIWMLCANTISIVDPSFLIKFPDISNRIELEKENMPNELPLIRTALKGVIYENWNSHPSLLGVKPNTSLIYNNLTANYYCSFIPYWSKNMSDFILESLNSDFHASFLQASSIRFVITKENLESTLELLDTINDDFGIINIYKNNNYLQRINLVSDALIISDEIDALNLIESGFDLTKSVLLHVPRNEIIMPNNTMSSVSDLNSHILKVLEERPDFIKIQITPPLTNSAFLVINDTYYPGWSSTVNGRDAQVLRANYAFRCVPLSAGSSEIIIRYNPLIPDWMLPLPSLVIILLLTITIVFYLKNCWYSVTSVKTRM